MHPDMLAKIGQALGGMSQGAGNPGGGLAALVAKLRGRMRGPSQGANLPQSPYHFPRPILPNEGGPGVEAYPMQPMMPGGFGSLPNQGPNIGPGMPNEMPSDWQPNDPGFQKARPRFPGDPGIDPGMTPPPDNSPFGPVPLGGRRPRKRFDFTGGY